ncbi:hypothetical protein [Pseudomonas sp. NFR09]|uniref:hypothetical protein n=1 Tax=Pseudomonas sp. NFR09 TaxID=1566249 RepID=UPI001113CA5A|nr:hypothetical protein [Pseudomonas sp. NFR09]
MMADQLRYAMHRDVLRVDPAAGDGIQDFPQHKLSAAEYDLATDRKIMRWRHIQQQPTRTLMRNCTRVITMRPNDVRFSQYGFSAELT